jgi:hypothetical protein
MRGYDSLEELDELWCKKRISTQVIETEWTSLDDLDVLESNIEKLLQ